MQLGLKPPIVQYTPTRNSAWELSAGVAELAQIVTAADRLRFDFMTCPEHLAVPDGMPDAYGVLRGTRFWDPITTFAYLAALTSSIRFAPMTLVLGYYHPLEIVKRYGCLDLLSGGRVILGVGVGSAREEFDALGADFARRGARADDALAAIRACFGNATPHYDGPFYQFSGLTIDPSFVQAAPPIWVGGHTMRSLERALQLGDGWAPMLGIGPDEARAMLAKHARPDDFEVVLTSPTPVDPLGERDRVARMIESSRAAGVTGLIFPVRANSLSHYLEQLEALSVDWVSLGGRS